MSCPRIRCGRTAHRHAAQQGRGPQGGRARATAERRLQTLSASCQRGRHASPWENCTRFGRFAPSAPHAPHGVLCPCPATSHMPIRYIPQERRTQRSGAEALPRPTTTLETGLPSGVSRLFVVSWPSRRAGGWRDSRLAVKSTMVPAMLVGGRCGRSKGCGEGPLPYASGAHGEHVEVLPHFALTACPRQALKEAPWETGVTTGLSEGPGASRGTHTLLTCGSGDGCRGVGKTG